MFNYSTLPKDNNHYYQYLKGNRNNGLHINTQSLGIHFNDQQQQEQQQDQSITSPSLLATCEPPLSPTTDDGSPSSSTSSTTTSPIFKNAILPCPSPLPHSLPQFVTRRKSTITRKPSSSSTSPQVTCQSWDHLKSPAAMFLAGFASPTTTTVTETETESTSTSLPSHCEEQEGDEIDDYVINEIIGYGGFSTVRKGYCISDGQTVALKIIKKRNNNNNNNNIEQDLDLRLEHELQIWQKMNHPYIVKIQKVLETDYANYIICDYCSNGTLLEKLQQKGLLNDQDKKRLFSQLVEAVHYLHQQCQVIHKDIKLDNVLLDDDMNVKLCDFGLAVYRQFTTSTPTHLSHLAHGDNNDLISSPPPPPSSSVSSPNSSTTSCHSGVGGSLAYCAPEQLKSSQILSCPKTDIWSLGIVLYAMFAGKLPFDDDYDVRLRQSILDGDYSMPSDFHPDLADLISHCLDPNPIHRFSLDQIMSHPWFSS
ncbi:unnamed protein product [Cunninghamella echinulata]